jgi:hypothetical protein
MFEESTTPDLVERTRHSFEAARRRDSGPALESYGPNAYRRPSWSAALEAARLRE